MSRIDEQNIKQIRDPMIVNMTIQFFENYDHIKYEPTAYKSYDETLESTAYPMRTLADLQGDGFLLDGTAEWYEPKEPSESNGKLGLRGNIGEELTVNISSSPRMLMLTIVCRGVDYFISRGRQYDVDGVVSIQVDDSTTRITFVPKDEYTRVEVDYIIPGAIFLIDNSNLIKATIALRSSLDPFATSLEASDIEIQMYYPEDISNLLVYVDTDWPITYSAGYSDEMSEVRRFYLSESMTWKDGVLTIHGTDNSLKLNKTIGEAEYINLPDETHGNFIFQSLWFSLYSLARNIQSCIGNAALSTDIEINELYSVQWDLACIRPEMSLSELIQRTMSLTANHEAQDLVIEYVDAGIPKLMNNRMSNVPMWHVSEEDLSAIQYTRMKNVSVIRNTNDTYKYDQLMTAGTPVVGERDPMIDTVWMPTFEAKKEQLLTITVPSASNYINAQAVWNDGTGRQLASFLHNVIRRSSTELVVNTDEIPSYVTDLYINVVYQLIRIANDGKDAYSNPNGLPGDIVDYDPLIYGRIVFNDAINWLSPKNLFNTKRNQIQFKFKGDPRWQPRDLIGITMRDGTETIWKISEIIIEHEGGGTMATVTAWEANIPTGRRQS